MKLHFYKSKIESSVEPEEIGDGPHLEVIETNEEIKNSVFERNWLRSLLSNYHFRRKKIIGRVESTRVSASLKTVTKTSWH